MRLGRWVAAATCIACPAAAARLPVPARPASVTLYDDRAMVSRQGELDLPAGDSTIVVAGVPGGILPDSVTARGQSDGPHVTIGAVESRPQFDAAAVTTRRAALDARLLEIDDEIAAVEAREVGFATQQTLIHRLAEAAGGTAQAPGLPSDPTHWQPAWSALRDGAREASEGVHKAQAEKRALSEQRGRLAAEAAAAGHPANVRDVAVAVHAAAPAHFTLTVTYQVANARWHPVYEARLDSSAARVGLRQSAVVTQSTGEDWANVALTLSTARPSAGVAPPDLAPWHITLMNPTPPAGVSLALPAPPPAPAPMETAKRVEADADTATLQTSGLALEYVIPGATTIRADGSAQTVRIADATLPASLVVRAVPRRDPRAYLSARFALEANAAPVLPGQVGLYVDGLFVGRGTLPLLRPGEATTLPFGVDDRVKLTYAPQEDKQTQNGGLFSSHRVSTVETLITAQNFHSTPIDIDVLDQVPVSVDGALKVDMIADPPPTSRNVDDRPGVMEWRATYQPNEQRRIRFGFTATAPEGRAIEGLTQ